MGTGPFDAAVQAINTLVKVAVSLRLRHRGFHSLPLLLFFATQSIPGHTRPANGQKDRQAELAEW